MRRSREDSSFLDTLTDEETSISVEEGIEAMRTVHLCCEAARTILGGKGVLHARTLQDLHVSSERVYSTPFGKSIDMDAVNRMLDESREYSETMRQVRVKACSTEEQILEVLYKFTGTRYEKLLPVTVLFARFDRMLLVYLPSDHPHSRKSILFEPRTHRHEKNTIMRFSSVRALASKLSGVLDMQANQSVPCFAFILKRRSFAIRKHVEHQYNSNVEGHHTSVPHTLAEERARMKHGTIHTPKDSYPVKSIEEHQKEMPNQTTGMPEKRRASSSSTQRPQKEEATSQPLEEKTSTRAMRDPPSRRGERSEKSDVSDVGKRSGELARQEDRSTLESIRPSSSRTYSSNARSPIVQEPRRRPSSSRIESKQADLSPPFSKPIVQKSLAHTSPHVLDKAMSLTPAERSDYSSWKRGGLDSANMHGIGEMFQTKESVLEIVPMQRPLARELVEAEDDDEVEDANEDVLDESSDQWKRPRSSRTHLSAMSPADVVQPLRSVPELPSHRFTHSERQRKWDKPRNPLLERQQYGEEHDDSQEETEDVHNKPRNPLLERQQYDEEHDDSQEETEDVHEREEKSSWGVHAAVLESSPVQGLFHESFTSAREGDGESHQHQQVEDVDPQETPTTQKKKRPVWYSSKQSLSELEQDVDEDSEQEYEHAREYELGEEEEEVSHQESPTVPEKRTVWHSIKDSLSGLEREDFDEESHDEKIDNHEGESDVKSMLEENGMENVATDEDIADQVDSYLRERNWFVNSSPHQDDLDVYLAQQQEGVEREAKTNILEEKDAGMDDKSEHDYESGMEDEVDEKEELERDLFETKVAPSTSVHEYDMKDNEEEHEFNDDVVEHPSSEIKLSGTLQERFRALQASIMKERELEKQRMLQQRQQVVEAIVHNLQPSPQPPVAWTALDPMSPPPVPLEKPEDKTRPPPLEIPATSSDHMGSGLESLQTTSSRGEQSDVEPTSRETKGLAFFVGVGEENQFDAERMKKFQQMRARKISEDAQRRKKLERLRQQQDKQASNKPQEQKKKAGQETIPLRINTERIDRSGKRVQPLNRALLSAGSRANTGATSRQASLSSKERPALWTTSGKSEPTRRTTSIDRENIPSQRSSSKDEPHLLYKSSRVELDAGQPSSFHSPHFGGTSSRSVFHEPTPPEIEPVVQITNKSNLKVVMNALTHVCLAGAHHLQRRQTVMRILEEKSSNGSPEALYGHFVIVFRNEVSLKFRGIYAVVPGTDELKRIQGGKSLPSLIHSKMIDSFFKYNTGQKRFQNISTKTLTKTTDAVALNPKYFAVPASHTPAYL